MILDRYMESNYAHQGAKLKGKKRGQMIDWIRDLETRILEIPTSDIVLFLDLPVEYTIEAIRGRNEQTGNKAKDLHEESIAYLKEAYKTYKALAQQDNWITIPCVGESGRYTQEEIANRIWQIAQPHLVNKFTKKSQ